MKDGEVKLEEIEASHTLGGVGKVIERGCGEGTVFMCEQVA
jgi:hypothetical protein